LQLHMLFLGLLIEPYRDCLLDLGKFRLSNTPQAVIVLEVRSFSLLLGAVNKPNLSAKDRG
jgi:hypothetical protein